MYLYPLPRKYSILCKSPPRWF
uniref:Uncharacterized protein n=1 Tax=Arundo donax TaxID=35708 RepID=A0A0A8ZPX2_ARUDO